MSEVVGATALGGPEHEQSVRAPGRSGLDRLIDAYRHRVWPTVVIFSLLALGATSSSSSGAYVGDNRFEQYFNPARRAARSMTIWDGFRGMGRVREDLWPGTTLPMAIFRSLGADPVLTQRLWHALLLVLVGVGVSEVVRLFRPVRRMEHLLAGLAAAFGAYSATFLTPFSNLYFQFVVGIWLVVIFYRGLHSDRPWRWAAAFALAVLAPGDVDTPGLMYNTLPLVWVSVYVLLVVRSVRPGRFAGFLLRAGVLTLAVNAAVLAKIYLGAATFGQRLNDTESAEVSFMTSSWPESIRGLGNWLSYFRDQGQLLKPQGAGYFNNPWIVLATFGIVVVAMVVPWISRWHPRILFSMMALGSLVVLVGAYPLEEPSPLGEQVYIAFREIPFLSAFRNTYKIGSGLVIGISVMFGVAIAGAHRRIQRLDRQLALLPVGLAALVLVGSSFPFWTGQLYNPNQTFDELPDYWLDATAWLDAQPGDGRVLILPPTSRSLYRWGWVGDDLFDSLLTRRHVVATGVPLTTPATANLVEAISFGASDASYVPGTLAPIARRLGIEYVVLRNDLDWSRLYRPRPADYSALRSDPDLELVATFGDPGENTTSPFDTSASVRTDATFPPVEVYRIEGAVTEPVRVEADQPSLVVSGDGWAWPTLARFDLLPSGGPPVEYSGSLDAAALTDRLRSGSPLVITDTNRRRLRVMLSYEPDYSHTLAEDEDLDRQPRSLFGDVAGAESVVWYRDADRIAMTGRPRAVSGSRAWSRPSIAFDGDPATKLTLRRAEGAAGRVLQVDLSGPRTVGRVEISVANVLGESDGVVEAVLRFSDGSEERLDLRGGTMDGPYPVRRIEATFPARITDTVQVELSRVAGTGPLVGLAEVTFPEVDLTEFVQVPRDVLLAAAEDEALSDALDSASVGYLFTRFLGAGEEPEETVLRRRFQVVRDTEYSLRGHLAFSAGTSDQAIAAMLDRPVPSYAPRRAEGDASAASVFAFDGDLTTGWAAAARAGETLDLEPGRAISTVTLVGTVGDGTPVGAFEVRAGDQVVRAEPEAAPCPLPGPDGVACWVAVASLPEPATGPLTVRVAELAGPAAPLGGGRVRVQEILLDGEQNAPLPAPETQVEGCADIGLRRSGPDGQWRPVPVRVEGTVGQLLAGDELAFSACEPLALVEGLHLLDSGRGTLLLDALLDPVERSIRTTPGESPGTASSSAASPTRVAVDADLDASATAIFQDGYAPGWFAEGALVPDGRQGAVMLDTLNGFRDLGPGEGEVTIRYRGQMIYGIALVITVVGVALCILILVVRGPAARRTSRAGPPEDAGLPDDAGDQP